MKKTKGTNASIFELNGIPQLSKHFAGFAACGSYDRWMRDPGYYCGRSGRTRGYNRVMLIQSALVVSALSTFLQLFPSDLKRDSA